MLPKRLRCFWIVSILVFVLCIGYICLSLFRPETPRLRAFVTNGSIIVPTSEQREDKQLVAGNKWTKAHITSDLTPLGYWLLSQEGTTPPVKTSNRSAPFLILVWKYGAFLERRHLRRFTRNKKFSPWKDCSVNNCQLTYKSEKLHVADAVIFHLHRTNGVKSLPRRRNRKQRWIFLSDESPLNTFLHRNQKISDYNGLFNWSMTYRMNSDIPVPYGRTIFSPFINSTSYSPKKRSSSKLAAILGSNCSSKNNNRWNYVRKLKRILGDKLDILGRCAGGNTTACPGHFDLDCPKLREYKFYLAFENSNCREYLSEKVFWNAYEKYSVPVIMGAPKIDCERLLPPGSYLHLDDFSDVSSLASYLTYLDAEDREYDKLHDWRRDYRVINEHGYFGSASKHYCRVCEALNYNLPEEKVYDRLQGFINAERDCLVFSDPF